MNLKILAPGLSALADALRGVDRSGHDVMTRTEGVPVGGVKDKNGEGLPAEYFGGVVGELIAAIRDIDDRINAVDRLLDELQPAQSGRLRVMWVSRRGKGFDGEKEPVVVIWRRNNKTERWSAEKLPNKNLARRAKTTGDFERVEKLVGQTLAQLSGLLETRQNVRERLTALDAEWSKARRYVLTKLKGMDAERKAIKEGFLALQNERGGGGGLDGPINAP